MLSLLHHKETNTLDILDLDQWSFYVLSKDKLKNISNNSSSISLIRLKKENIEPVNFSILSEKIQNL